MEPLDLKQSYIPQLKVLVCGINEYGFQLRGCIFMLCHTHMNLALVRHKIVLVTFLLGSTVIQFLSKYFQI